ncbi:MAG: YqgE/AlgH family protein [Saprospiraceae bacterium]|nr:YqgE/AlgH family protein [Saprospiraceae bacterium]MDZ4702470.1 YqgE/AlgH family protein [Saprospiraceae bacterium]
MVRSEIKSGKVLLAEPFMMDPNFRRSAILLCEHTNENSIGFIMNKPLDVRIDELIKGFPEFESTVLFGGPVQTDTIHYIHNSGALLEGSLRIMDGVYWGGDFEKLKFLIHTQLILPENIRFFVGYSGWSEGQLTDEMSYGSWLVADMDANYLFKTLPDKLWRQAMSHKGDTFAIIAGMPEQLIWN